MSKVSLCILPQRPAVHGAGKGVHGYRGAEPYHNDLYLELDHVRYPVAEQCEGCVGNERPDGDEEGLDISIRRGVLDVSARVAEPEKACLNDVNAGKVAEYLMTQLVQDDAGEG